MKLLLIALVSLSTAYAGTTADVTCSLSQPIVVQGTFGTVAFRQAELDFTTVDKDNAFSTFLTMQDRFGTAYESFNRLFEEKSRCNSGDFCLNTDFSSIRGLSFNFPQAIFTNENHSFTMRVRNNRSHRTFFARCNSSLRNQFEIIF
jgi:hypothetical protein